MHPTHNSITIPRPTQPKRLPPNLPLFLLQLLQLLIFRLLSPFRKLPLTRNPPPFATLVHKLGRMLLEYRDGEQGEFVVGGELRTAAGDDHRSDGFVGREIFFDEDVGDGEEVLLEVFRGVGGEEGAGIDDRGEGALREISGAVALRGGEVGLCGVVLVEFGFDVVVYTCDFLWLDSSVSLFLLLSGVSRQIMVPPRSPFEECR